MRHRYPASLLAFLVLLPGLPASAYTITLNGYAASSLESAAAEGGGYHNEIVNPPAAVPYFYTSTSHDGGSSTESTYILSNVGFDITFDHSRASAYASYSETSGEIHFSVDTNIAYSASGSYAASDPDGLLTYYEVFLEDLTVGEDMFASQQYSLATPNESFSLGGTGGDYDNYSTGLLTGTLAAGHDYRLAYVVAFQAYPSPATSLATATGGISLTFVPEPGTALLLAVGLITLTAWRHRLH